jgi:hypothetical protein
MYCVISSPSDYWFQGMCKAAAAATFFIVPPPAIDESCLLLLLLLLLLLSCSCCRSELSVPFSGEPLIFCVATSQ